MVQLSLNIFAPSVEFRIWNDFWDIVYKRENNIEDKWSPRGTPEVTIIFSERWFPYSDNLCTAWDKLAKPRNKWFSESIRFKLIN